MTETTDKLLNELRELAAIVADKHRQTCLNAILVIETQRELLDFKEVIERFLATYEDDEDDEDDDERPVRTAR